MHSNYFNISCLKLIITNYFSLKTVLLLPFEICESRGVSEAFSKGIAVDLELSNELILICCDSSEYHLWVNISSVILILQICDGVQIATHVLFQAN